MASGASTAIPWPLKVATKLLLARLPGSARHWHRAGLFRHGAMDSPNYALKVLKGHLQRAGLAPADLAGKACLELGPGDSPLSAVILRAWGAARATLVDAGDFARGGVALCRQMAVLMAAEGFPLPEVEAAASAEQVLAACNAEYLTEGLASLRALPDRTFDFLWSQAVLEHIRRDRFAETLRALHRIQKPEGLASHRVDLRDHLGGALNHLRFADWFWENDTVAGSGFYTNRIGCAEMLGLFESAGFQVELLGARRWEALPTQRTSLAERFRARPEADLLVRSFDVLLRTA